MQININLKYIQNGKPEGHSRGDHIDHIRRNTLGKFGNARMCRGPEDVNLQEKFVFSKKNMFNKNNLRHKRLCSAF